MLHRGRASWASMARTARAPIAVLAIGGLGLTVPPQTYDMLVFLENGGFWPFAAFQIALFVLGFCSWFWARAALAARFGIPDHLRDRMDTSVVDNAAFVWLPRALLIGAFTIGVTIGVRDGDYHAAALASTIGILALLAAWLRPKRPRAGIPSAPRTSLSRWFRGGATHRLAILLDAATIARSAAIGLLVLGAVPLALGTVEAFTSAMALPNRLALAFPGPSIAVLLLGLMIGPLTVLTFVFDGLSAQFTLRGSRLGPRRPPVITILFVYIFVVVPALFDVHTVRVSHERLPDRKPLDVLFEAWVQACAPGPGPVQPIIVAVSGGATRAGLWGAAVLDQVLRAAQPGGPALFAVSSVSGGSLGVAAAMTLMSQQEQPCRAISLAPLQPEGKLGAPLAGDALGPLLAGWLANDIPRAAFDPLAAIIRRISGQHPNGGDSAEAIERAFEGLWKNVQSAGPQWDKPFLSLFYDGNEYRKGMPLWFANGTDASTGNRIITSPIATSNDDVKRPWPFRGARDFHALMHADVAISTAINNTARFPYLEPFGQMLSVQPREQVGSLVDGGYFENEGLQTALDLADWLAQRKVAGRTVSPIIVQATGDGEIGVMPRDIMTCANASDDPSIGSRHSAWQILAPLIGLNHVRGGHSAVLLRQAHDQLCPNGQPARFIHFYLPAINGRAVPLNWVLSDAVAQAIWHSFDDSQTCNGEQLLVLQNALSRELSMSGHTSCK